MSKLNFSDIELEYKKYFGSDNPQPLKKNKKIKQPSSLRGDVVRFTESGKPISVYASHLDKNAWEQASLFAEMPFVHPRGMALMPDVHFGKHVPVGSVLPTLGVLVPAAVGVDIGCGMIAAKLNVSASELPDNLRHIRREIERSIPMGKSGLHKVVQDSAVKEWSVLEDEYKKITSKTKNFIHKSPVSHMGTLGSGNHFVEICIDENKSVWVMLHSGSRGPGAMIGEYFINQALRRVKECGSSSKGFGWLQDEDPIFHDYVEAMTWAQDFARINRKVMLDASLRALSSCLKKNVLISEKVVSCHHNYIAQEIFDGKEIWITRKGAISARKGELGIIPSAMGQESFIIKGLGNDKSWCSCSHGSGRVMSRTAASQRYTQKDMKEALRGIECRKDRGVVDEIPYAYKNIRQVMKDQHDLVEVVHTLKAVVCCKGV